MVVDERGCAWIGRVRLRLRGARPHGVAHPRRPGRDGDAGGGRPVLPQRFVMSRGPDAPRRRDSRPARERVRDRRGRRRSARRTWAAFAPEPASRAPRGPRQRPHHAGRHVPGRRGPRSGSPTSRAALPSAFARGARWCSASCSIRDSPPTRWDWVARTGARCSSAPGLRCATAVCPTSTTCAVACSPRGWRCPPAEWVPW